MFMMSCGVMRTPNSFSMPSRNSTWASEFQPLVLSGLERRSRLSAGATRTFDRLVPVISAIERLIPVPVGQSVIVVGRL